VHYRQVRHVESALERLQVVAVLDVLRDVPVRRGGAQQFAIGRP
jgi:hypothetical protein